MRRLFLVRHGETEGQSSIRLHGRSDVHLSDEGRAQVRRLGPRVATERFAAVVHSPLARAAESAAILLETIAEPPSIVEVEADFAEVDFGELEGMAVTDVEAQRPEWYRAWRADGVDGYPGGERIEDFAVRVAAGFVRVLERHPDGDLLVVAHKGVIKRGLVALRALGPAAVHDLKMDLGSLWVLRGHEEWVLELANVVG